MDIEIQHLNLDSLTPSEKNARFMPEEKMTQLVANLRKDGVLTSTPLVYHNNLRIISGHHRVQAALLAGIQSADCMVITSDISEEHLTAIQLSHNSLAGEDNPRILKEMLEMLAPLEQEFAAVTLELPKLPAITAQVDQVPTIQFGVHFLPSEVKRLKPVIEKAKKAEIWLEPNALLDEFSDIVIAIKQHLPKTIKSRQGVIMAMAQLAMQRIKQLEKDGGNTGS